MRIRPVHSDASCRRRRGGFTLVELLVCIGIIALIAGIALPALVSVRKSARRSAMNSQLQVIFTALEQYKHENFEMYPPIDLTPVSPPYIGDNGAFALCRALFGPAPAVATNTGDLFDNKDGPGFRREPGNGKVFGPYLVPDTFRFGYAVPDGAGGYAMSPPGASFVSSTYGRLMVADQSGKPILYCPPITTRPRFNGSNNVYFADRKSLHPTTDVVYFNLDNLLGPATTPTPEMLEYRGILRMPNETTDAPFIARAQAILGADPAANGKLVGSQPTFIAPLLLWSAGPDGLYGKIEGKNFDDVILTD